MPPLNEACCGVTGGATKLRLLMNWSDLGDATSSHVRRKRHLPQSNKNHLDTKKNKNHLGCLLQFLLQCRSRTEAVLKTALVRIY